MELFWRTGTFFVLNNGRKAILIISQDKRFLSLVSLELKRLEIFPETCENSSFRGSLSVRLSEEYHMHKVKKSKYLLTHSLKTKSHQHKNFKFMVILSNK